MWKQEPVILTLGKPRQENSSQYSQLADFLGSSFSVKSIIRKANAENNVKIKIINELNMLDNIIENVSGTKEIYHFYLNEPFYENEKNVCNGIQIPSTEDINIMI